MRFACIIILAFTAFAFLPLLAQDRITPPAGESDPAGKASEKETKKGTGHGTITIVDSKENKALVKVDKGIEFKVGEKLMAAVEGSQIAYLTVEKVIISGTSTSGALCMCKADKGASNIMAELRVINMRIRDEQSPQKKAPDSKKGTDPASKLEDKREKSRALTTAMLRVAELEKTVSELQRKIDILEKKLKLLDYRIVSLERQKPDSGVKLPEGLDPQAQGIVLKVYEDELVAISIGTEVGIKVGTILYIYRPQGDGNYFHIGSLTVTDAIEGLSRGKLNGKHSKVMDNDIVTVRAKTKSTPDGEDNSSDPSGK